MTRSYLDFLEDSSMYIYCKKCDTQISHMDDIIQLNIETENGKCILLKKTNRLYYESDIIIKCNTCMKHLGTIHLLNKMRLFLLLKEAIC